MSYDMFSDLVSDFNPWTECINTSVTAISQHCNERAKTLKSFLWHWNICILSSHPFLEVKKVKCNTKQKHADPPPGAPRRHGGATRPSCAHLSAPQEVLHRETLTSNAIPVIPTSCFPYLLFLVFWRFAEADRSAAMCAQRALSVRPAREAPTVTPTPRDAFTSCSLCSVVRHTIGNLGAIFQQINV